MADHQVIINSQVYKLIPLGFCACGCGGKTRVPVKNCKQYGHIKGQPIKFINGHNHRGKSHPQWKGGRFKRRGYVFVHSLNCKTRNHRLEHIIIAEKVLGKPLPEGVVVHHVDGNRDSGPLVICQDRAYHALLHRRMRALKECGHANWRKCWICKQWDSPENLYVGKNTNYHAACHNNENRDRRLK